MIIRLDIDLRWKLHDRGMYNDSDRYRHPHDLFSDGEAAIGVTGFQSQGIEIIFPFKQNQLRSCKYGRDMNRDIRRHRIRNEWSVGLVLNSFRVLLGNWSLRDCLCPLVCGVDCLLVNIRIK